jgi:hypothetical protein
LKNSSSQKGGDEMINMLRVSLFALVLVVVVISLSLFSQSLLSIAAEQVLYSPLESADNTFAGEPYPPPSFSRETYPYPPPVTEGIFSIDNESAKYKDVLLEDAKIYASIFNIGVEEAAKRLTLQEITGNINTNLVKKEDTTYAGLWIQHEPYYRVIVRFTSNGDVTIRSYIQESPLLNLVEVRTADVSLKELKLEQLQTTQIMSQSNIPFSTGINVMENRVEVYVLDTAEVTTFLQDLKTALPDHTRIIKVNEIGKEVTDIYGGLALTTCTSGFSVVDNEGIAGITTAGHCSNQQYYNYVLLPFKAGTTGGDYDIQWHRGDHAFNVVGRIEDGLGGRAILDEKLRDSQVVGDFVCKYGKTTGRECGFIAQVYVNGTNVRVDDVLVEGGDSGGPWFLSDIAYGTTIYSCELGDGTPCAVYGPVDIIHDILGLAFAYRIYLLVIVK